MTRSYEYNRADALRMVLGTIQPILDIEVAQRLLEDAIAECELAMVEEPEFGEAFDAVVKAVFDAGYDLAKTEK